MGISKLFADVDWPCSSFGMQTVPARRFPSLTGEFVVTGDTPQVGEYTKFLFQQLSSRHRLPQDRTAAEKLDARRRFATPGRLT